MAAQRRVQQNREVHVSVEGTAVRKHDIRVEEPVRLKKRSKSAVSQSKALRRQKHRFVALGIVAGAVIVALAGLMLITLEQKSELNREISRKESTLSDLAVYNEAKEYEINNSVDLNYIIQVATENLGMVRSNASQVVTYSVKNSEYLLQVAAVPTE